MFSTPKNCGKTHLMVMGIVQRLELGESEREVVSIASLDPQAPERLVRRFDQFPGVRATVTGRGVEVRLAPSE